MLTAHLLAAIETLAPARLAEDWDNVGLLVGRHNHPVRRVLVALDLRDDVLLEAQDADCQVVLVHHPPIFPSLGAVTDDTPAQHLVLSAAEHRIAVIAAHTNLDAARDGLNDQLASLLGMRGAAPLAPAEGDPGAGLGRVGDVDRVTFEAFAARVARLIPGAVTAVGDPDAHVERIACCTGSGASLIDAARAADAQAYVTGDLKYHDADRAHGMPLVDVPHGQTERLALRGWCEVLRRAVAADGIETRFSECDTDPWRSVAPHVE